MRWSEVRRYPSEAATVRLLRRETRIPMLNGFTPIFVPRKRWRVEVREPTASRILLETRSEADAWAAYLRESRDER